MVFSLLRRLWWVCKPGQTFSKLGKTVQISRWRFINLAKGYKTPREIFSTPASLSVNHIQKWIWDTMMIIGDPEVDSYSRYISRKLKKCSLSKLSVRTNLHKWRIGLTLWFGELESGKRHTGVWHKLAQTKISASESWAPTGANVTWAMQADRLSVISEL